MPTDTRTPAAQGVYSQATLVAGASKPSAMAANDNGGSYISISPPGSLVDSYTTSGWPTNIGTVSNWLVGYVGGNVSGSQICQWAIVCPHGSAAGGNYSGAYWGVLSGNPAHPGGGSWSAADCVNSTELEVLSTSGTGTSYFSYVWLSYGYTLTGGSFLYFASLLLPLVGAALDAATFGRAWRAMARTMDSPHGFTRFRPEEVRTAWAEWRAYR